MKDSDKTKSQLIQELSELRQHISAQEKYQTIRESSGLDLKILDYALASSINGIGITDLEGKFIYVNDSIVKMWGVDSKEEILGKHLFEFWEGDTIQRTVQALQQTGGTVGEDIGKRKDGSLFEVQFSASIIKDEKGNPMYMFGSFIDISEHKLVKKQILVANERLQYLLSATSAVIYTAKTSGDYGATFISDNVTQLVGFEPREFLEESSFWIDQVHPDDFQKISQEVTLLFEKEFHKYEYRFKHKKGTYIWLRDEMKVVRDEKGEPLEIIGYWIDITERKKIEKKLQKAHDVLEKRVEERTAALTRTNIHMEQEIKDRKQAESALKESELKLREQKLMLEQKNIALGEIIAQIEIEKIKIKDDIATNINTVILPFIEKYKTNEAAEKYGDFLRHHLNELTSSFGVKITERRIDLTPREVEICSMIKGGLLNKDISHLLNISNQTVEGHRKNIRRKLGIINKKINLTSFLRAL